ncbi:group XIIB secretory phospholipase A2-like protein [Cololabis saira]|uniref:group XIIB secretory phospholipase A2-like protein n=1 Tax=Cololabis saira TaxID=129043 RepID=UPI002AD2C483|nr:group XIIB secretory phospholipase A2-like protein [Cololabis saira]
MLLRTGALLFLFTSLGSCATLVYFQAEAAKVEAPAVEPGADGDGIFTVNKQGGEKPETETFVAHDATETDIGKPAGDAPAVDPLSVEAVNVEHVSSRGETNEIRPIQTNNSPNKPPPQEDASIWSMDSLRNGVQTVHGYFDSLVELAGGHNGVCQYRCRHGGRPQPRPGYQLPEPDGCSSALVGFQLDVGIPAMTKCCNQLDACYDICGRNKYDCDAKFRVCLHAICSDLRRSLGFVSKVRACETMADGLYSTVWTLGCRSYMNSQRAACVCPGEERDEL